LREPVDQNESATTVDNTAWIALGRILIALRERGIKPTTPAILGAATDDGAGEHLTAEIADLIASKGQHHARSSAGGIVCG